MLRPGQIIVLCVVALLTIGVIMVNSADMGVRTVTADQPALEPFSIKKVLVSRSAIYMVLALVALTLTSLIPVRRLASWAQNAGAETSQRTYIGMGFGVLALLLTCALVYVPGLEREVKGSHRWINIPGTGDALSLQPSELAKWGMIVLVSWYAVRMSARRSDSPNITHFWKGLVPALLGIGIVSAFVVVEDLGTGALIACSAALVLLAGGARIAHFALLSPLPAAAFVLAVITSDYRVARIMAFLDPYKAPEGIGYHTIQSLVAVSNGGGFGRGLGFGIQKQGYLPEDRTDFIFAVLCEETGIAGATLVICLFAGLLWSAHSVMRRENSPFLRLIVLGIGATVVLQAIINLAVVTAMAPTKGIALPLVSSGGTGWVLTAASLGLIVAIDRTQQREESVHAPGSIPAVT